MRIWRNDNIILAISDEGKMFKTENGYFTRIPLTSEEEAELLTEVYFHNGIEITEEIHRHYELIHELKKIHEWFESTDYIPNKVVVGEWEETDERFIAYKAERQIKRARQDEIKALLSYQ